MPYHAQNIIQLMSIKTQHITDSILPLLTVQIAFKDINSKLKISMNYLANEA